MTVAVSNLQEQGKQRASAQRAGATGWASLEARASAYHEAAHAVVCFVLYGQEVIREVSVQSDGNADPGLSTFSRLPIPIVCRPAGGEPRRGNPAPVSSGAIVDAHGVLQYSGSAAEALLSSWDETPDFVAGEAAQRRHLSDREALCTLSSLVRSERPEDVFYEEYWREAVRLLRSNWPAVEELAKVLKRHTTLSGTRVDQLLGAFLPG